ncbi:hypothetical protein, partial [Escherichia coli]|uniref:hypothetical protein n=1 Tax=Escherichia coli TaxID=562 RepID=UPI003CC6110B
TGGSTTGGVTTGTEGTGAWLWLSLQAVRISRLTSKRLVFIVQRVSGLRSRRLSNQMTIIINITLQICVLTTTTLSRTP